MLAGFGLIFTGIDFLQTGMGGVSWNLDAFAGHGFGARWILAGIGILMSIVMQSSTAAGATTLVALNAGSLTFQQDCAMIVGQSIGTAATTGLVMIGGGLAVRRASMAHIIFSVIVGIFGILFLGPLTAAAEWVGTRLYDPDGVLAMETFSSLFRSAGSGSIVLRDSSFGSLGAAANRPLVVSILPLPKRERRSRSKPPGGRV